MNKKIIVGILVVLVATPVISPTMNQGANAHNISSSVSTLQKAIIQNDVQATCYSIGKLGTQRAIVKIPSETAEICYTAFHQLLENITLNPHNENTQHLKHEFITLLAENNLIPTTIPPDQYDTLLNPPWVEKLTRNYHAQVHTPASTSTLTAGAATAFICSIGGEGNGVLFPFIMLPRPRIITTWAALDGATTVGKFLTYGGFAAGGAQFGTALGFWGIGLAFAFPYGTIYGFVGYALFAAVTAQYIERYPPNHAPIIINTQPNNQEQNIPVSLSELSFSIEDPDGDLMSYSVITNPDIGSGSGNLKTAGTYSVPVHDLQELTEYSWTLTVSDKDTVTEQTYMFTTQALSPVVSNPLPADGEKDVPMDISQLQFTLRDYQGDTMEYTVQTSPNIGSDHKVGVHNGTYVVPVSGLTYGIKYQWFINATDGTHWTHKVFDFETGYPSQFNPFDFGWQYRKQITIDHTQIDGTLPNFPVLLSMTDSDLIKAQTDGRDILFMNGSGVSLKLHHEIETYSHASGNLIAWINVPVLSPNQDTILYLYYGNPNSINQEYPQKVWDSYYQAVWHMNDATLNTIDDSTFNSYTGIKAASNEPTEINGITGKAQSFDGLNDNIWINGQSVLGIGDKTISFWMKSDVNSNYQTILTNALGGTYNDAGLDLSIDLLGTTITSLVGNGLQSGHYLFLQGEPLPDHTMYHYYTATQSETNLSLFVDGSLYGWTTVTSGSESPPNYNMSIGRSHENSPNFYWFDGQMDELRMSNIARPGSWIKTEYHNQNSPNSFLTVGPEEPDI
jgi:hypothetical protein